MGVNAGMGAPSAQGVHPGGGGLMLGWGHLAPGEWILGMGVNAGMGPPGARECILGVGG